MPAKARTVGEAIAQRGVSRRALLQYCSLLATAMALPAGSGRAMAAAVAAASRQSVIWLSFQECTGCTESITRSSSPSLEDLILDMISLDYHHTLQAASGAAAEEAREHAMRENAGRYLVIVDGAVPGKETEHFSTIAGVSNYQMLQDTARDAMAVITVGTCAAYGGLPAAKPNPTGARPVGELVTGKPVVNIPGCPPIPTAMTGVIAHLLTFGKLPELDALGRPRAFFGETIHDRCYRRPFYDQGRFAKSFDDEGARSGWCLYELGCKGPITYNACATVKWNDSVSFPIQSGHGCLGCSEPGFWDKGSFYRPLAAGDWGSRGAVAAAAGVGIALGAVSAALARRRQRQIEEKQ
jgi:hydrogenase small subunit